MPDFMEYANRCVVVPLAFLIGIICGMVTVIYGSWKADRQEAKRAAEVRHYVRITTPDRLREYAANARVEGSDTSSKD